MQLIILIGIPGSGKSTFYNCNFLNSHVRISLDLLNTRNKENFFLTAGFNIHQKMVIDNTNVKKIEREKYIKLAKKNNYSITGYFFNVGLNECLTRNRFRTGKGKVEDKVIFIKHHQLEKPLLSEGFDKLFEVKVIDNEFHVSDYHE